MKPTTSISQSGTSLTRAQLRFSISTVHVYLHPTAYLSFSHPFIFPSTLVIPSTSILIPFYHTRSLSKPSKIHFSSSSISQSCFFVLLRPPSLSLTLEGRIWFLSFLLRRPRRLRFSDFLRLEMVVVWSFQPPRAPTLGHWRGWFLSPLRRSRRSSVLFPLLLKSRLLVRSIAMPVRLRLMSRLSEFSYWFFYLGGIVCAFSLAHLLLSYLIDFFFGSLCSVLGRSVCGDHLLKCFVSWFYNSLLDSFHFWLSASYIWYGVLILVIWKLFYSEAYVFGSMFNIWYINMNTILYMEITCWFLWNVHILFGVSVLLFKYEFDSLYGNYLVWGYISGYELFIWKANNWIS